MEENDTNLPNELRNTRIRAGYKQEDVAFLLNIRGVGRVSEWETGISHPGLENLIKLEIIYQTLLGELYYDLRQKYVKEIADRAQLLRTRKIQKKRPDT